jgi:putative redox protein
MQASVKFVDGLRFVGEADSGHALLMDGDPTYGGFDSAPRPMELLLMGLGGCTGMDTVSILRKKKQPFTGVEINIKGTRAEQYPMRFTDITIEFVIKGKGVSEEAVKRAVGLSMEKYCSVKATLESGAKVDFTYRIEEG